MKRVVLIAGLLAACAQGGSGGGGGKATTPPRPAGDKIFTPAEIADRALPSVVLIKTPNIIGTGFIVWQDGRVATNLHVIAGAREASVLLNDGRQFDQAHDLAILRLPVTGLTPLPLGDSLAVKPGEHVVAIGHPMGMGNTVSDGLVSGIRKIDPKVTWLQISAPISPGSSGGPIFNEHGEVIGVATAYSSEGQNLNFGAPVQYLKPLLLAERGTPLAAFASELDAALLTDCSLDEVKLVVGGIEEAIKLGAPLFNKGDAKGCSELYEKASLKVVGGLKMCPGVRETLLGGLSNASKATDPREKAWALRHAFDRILAAFEAAVNNAEVQDRAKQKK